MRWVEEKSEFERIFLDARTCVYIDSGRESTELQRLVFDDAAICTTKFAALVQDLLTLSEDPIATYCVLDPDPRYYFWEQFKKYPFVQIGHGDPAEEYIAFLNEDPGGSPIDAVGTNWWECVIVPPSAKWFVHALRDSDPNGGHLWIPKDWRDRLVETHTYLRRENQ